MEPPHSTRWCPWRALTPSYFTATWAVSGCLVISDGVCRKPVENSWNLPSLIWEGRGWLWLWQLKIPGPCNEGGQLVNTRKGPSYQGFTFTRMRKHIWPCWLPCIFMLALKVTVIWTCSCNICKKCAFFHKAENMDQTQQVRKHIAVCPKPEQLRNGILLPQLSGSGMPRGTETNISYCRDGFADPKMLEAAPDEAGGFNEGSSMVQTLCTTPGRADTLLWHIGHQHYANSWRQTLPTVLGSKELLSVVDGPAKDAEGCGCAQHIPLAIPAS